MNWLDLTLPTPAENLAFDEALLTEVEATGGTGTLRFWESGSHFVVMGYAARAAAEANLSACQAEGVPVYRRCSGGGTVLQGPGCLNYTLLLPIEEHGPTATITGTNSFVMERHCRALALLLNAPVRIEGHTDLTLDGLKFSGNAQRRRKSWLLFHGTFLVGLDLGFMERLLPAPPRPPDYRRQRPHAAFLTQLSIRREALKTALRDAWRAHTARPDPPMTAIEKLVAEKYSRPEWNLRW